MQRWHAYLQLILARIREFYREPEAIFWVYGFPLILAIGLGIAFSRSQPDPPTVDIEDLPDRARAEALKKLLEKHGVTVEVGSEKECHDRMVQGHSSLVLVVDGSSAAKNRLTLRFKYDPARPEAMLAKKWVEAVVLGDSLGSSGPVFEEIKIDEPGSRYIDFLLPGLIGMNIMGGGLFGVGFVLVDMRAKKLFKRLLATPMRRGDFLLSLLTTRMLFLAPEMLSLLLLGWLYFGIPLRGSVASLLAVILCGALAFAGIGLLVGCRTEKTETISGLINLVMLPMYLVSGIFFPSTKFPAAAQPFIQALPLTQINDGLRAVMLEGKSLADISWRLGILAVWATVTFTLALWWFRWR